ncbi:MAG: RNA-binding protein [Firmicutes bacterium]|nr:RNA-binding protein [Bacillota bacterium]
MEEKSRTFLAGRVRDLALRAYQNNYVTSTEFLSLSEQNAFFGILASEGVPAQQKSYQGAKFVIYGGFEDAERAKVCFLPEYMDEESFLLAENAEPSVLKCVRAEPVNSRFADDLTHRDYLGALMNMGIERDQRGDILTGEDEAYVFATPQVADLMVKELIRIRHTSVRCTVVSPSECNIRPSFSEVSGSVASERIDAVVAFVYHLSRSEAQKLIESEQVFVDGRTAYSGGYDLKPGARVSVRGHGKFIYDGPQGTTRKGRLFVKVRVFR